MIDRPAPRWAASLTVVLVSIVVLAVLSVAAMSLRGGSDVENGNGAPDVFEVRRGGFDVTIPASGELAALNQTDVASRLEARAVITYIIEEGVLVKTGDVLIRLDDKDITTRIKDAEDAVSTADNALVTAISNLDLRKQANRSELDEADLQIYLAELALRAWEEGEVVSTQTRLKLEVQTATKDHERLVDRYEASIDLLKQNFISEDEFKRDEIAMIQAGSRLEQARLAVQVYEDYQHEQDKAKKKSDLKQAEDRRSQLEQRHATEIKSLENTAQSRDFQLSSKKERLADLRRQLELCTISAPQDGLVVYASSLSTGRGMRGGDESPPDVGTELRRNRTVIVLPDTSKMIAAVKVNEALSGRIREGQQAIVFSDAVPDTPLRGEVISVGVLAESGGWRDPNRRDYTVRIQLSDGNDLGLKPSMRCKADIFVAQVNDVLYVPIPAIFRKGAAALVYVPEGSGYEQRRVEVGRSSELYIEVLAGLSEGDHVLLREPSADRVRSQLDTRQENGATDHSAPGRSSGHPGGRGGRGGPS